MLQGTGNPLSISLVITTLYKRIGLLSEMEERPFFIIAGYDFLFSLSKYEFVCKNTI